ncbi:MAG: PDZ domain-containing protein [Ruminococcaceae bacterium]|nr:PDZ domain-containing protein [Oscillospiraceae bacterium]
MKKILFATLLILAIFTISVFAENNVVTSDTQENGQTLTEDEYKALMESLVKGIVPLTPSTTYDDFISYLSIIDESDNKMLTSKFETFVYLIEYYHYGNLSRDEIFEKFKSETESVDINDMDTAYKTLFSVLDKFSYYLTPAEAEQFFSPNSAKGIGIKMLWKDSDDGASPGIYVDEVAKASPAEEAGIAVGDRIVEFNGTNVRGLGFEALAVYNSMVPQDMETLTVKLERNGEEKEYVITRKTNNFSDYAITLYPEKALISLDINSFMNDDTALDISAELDRAYSEGYRNVIIDLQGNSGGDVYVAASILSKFTPYKQPLFYMGRDGKTNSIPFISDGSGYVFDNITILVDSSTASSAEIFAQTLGNIAGARIVGEQTYGKGVAQSVFSFEDGAAVGVTTYVAYDIYGKTYNEVGIIPDAKVTAKIERNALPAGTPALTALNFTKAVDGAENSSVLGLEIRLEAIGFLSESEVDGVWADATARAIKALQLGYKLEATGALDLDTYHLLTKIVKAWENTYYYTYTAFDYAYRFIPYK